jgi:hypothetical protein
MDLGLKEKYSKVKKILCCAHKRKRTTNCVCRALSFMRTAKYFQKKYLVWWGVWNGEKNILPCAVDKTHGKCRVFFFERTANKTFVVRSIKHARQTRPCHATEMKRTTKISTQDKYDYMSFP